MSNRENEHRELSWSQVDVFAEAAFEGNMLAIFHDGRGLSDEAMQALARETNLSETTFILPRDEAEERDKGIRVRIFTTNEELPFAGHPTLGTASWLWLHHPIYRGAGEIALHLNSGTVTVRFGSGDASHHGVVGEMTQHDPAFGSTVSRLHAASSLGLDADDLMAGLEPQVVSTGLPFLIVPLRSVEAASRLAVRTEQLAPLLRECGAHFAYCLAPVAEPGSDAQWHARMPFYGGEDPATGSAAGCAVSYLVQHGICAPDRPIVIRQGVEMRRPSRITACAAMQQGAVRNVRVSGRTIPVATGRFIRP